jgi:hypothetical protein
MHTDSRPSLITTVSWTAAVCLALGGFFLTSCDRPPASDSTTSSSSTSANDAAIAGVVLQADPNPVPPGNPKGTTTITWDTGSDAVGDVFVVNAGIEKLFASGRQGSQDAPWIQAGSTEFRLYTQADHKLLAQLTVTMPSSDASVNRQSATPISTTRP